MQNQSKHKMRKFIVRLRAMRFRNRALINDLTLIAISAVSWGSLFWLLWPRH